MKNKHQLNDIIDQYAPDIASGRETVDSVIEKYSQFEGELRPRLEALVWLTNARTNLEPRPGFISSSRTCIERQVTNQPSQNFWQRLYRRYTPQHLAFYATTPALIIVLLALIFNSLVFTARLALPGETLYPTKIFMENFRLAMTFNQAKKAELYIQYTRERSSEIVDLVLDGNFEIIPAAASELETEMISSLHSLNMLNDQNSNLTYPLTSELRETLSSELFMLNVMRASSPSVITSGINQAINVAQTGLMALR